MINKLIVKIYEGLGQARLYLMKGRKSVVQGVDGIFYYEVGNHSKDTIILIHGFADNKDGHLMVAKKLASEYRILIPDLPGFGENKRDHEQEYSISYMSEKIIELIDEKKLTKFHLLGNSLGGAVAMEIVSMRPSLIKSLTLVGSAGFYSPAIRTVQNDLLEGDYIFQVNSDMEFKQLIERVFAKTPKIPMFLFNYLSSRFQAQSKWYGKLIDDLVGAASDSDSIEKLRKDSFNDKSKEFPMSTLLLWGEEDRIIPLEMGKFANTIVPNSKLIILKKAGHAPQHENLLDYMEALLVFLKENET